MNYCGIDPGMRGGWAFIGDDIVPMVRPMPILNKLVDEHVCRDWLALYASDDMHIFLEAQQSMPGQGAPGTFLSGRNYGRLEMIISRIPHSIVRAGEWKKKMRLSSDKAQSVERARQLFPMVTLRASEDGKAEALLLAYYGKNHILGFQEVPML